MENQNQHPKVESTNFEYKNKFIKNQPKVYKKIAIIILVFFILLAGWLIFKPNDDPFKNLNEQQKKSLYNNSVGQAEVTKKERKSGLHMLTEKEDGGFIDYIVGAQQAIELKDKQSAIKLADKAEKAAGDKITPQESESITKIKKEAESL